MPIPPEFMINSSIAAVKQNILVLPLYMEFARNWYDFQSASFNVPLKIFGTICAFAFLGAFYFAMRVLKALWIVIRKAMMICWKIDMDEKMVLLLKFVKKLINKL